MNRAPLCLLLVLCGSLADAADEDRKGLDFFEAKIRPMLIKHCYECHSAKAAATKTLKGGLLVDTRAGLRTGGESGPAVVPGKPEESVLISALRHETFKMPPKMKLPDSLIGHFVKWIKLGAPDPRTGAVINVAEMDIAAGRKHWAFQPLGDVAPPAVRDRGWIRTAVDQFVLARQIAAQVEPNTLASPRVLIRRAYFDLIGLPPEPESVEAFVVAAEQDLPAAYAALIDELLQSPHYGERWARHWLDLVRFAESNGYAFDKDRPNAFQYRDWVIRALNSDMPYDEFVRLQIGGDLLANANAPTAEAAQAAVGKFAATGFLVAGPFTTQQTQKERERSRYEQLDDMIQTLGTSMLGLTVGCCRCHNHKYDPLPMHDYYQLASSFADVGFADTGINMQPEAFREAKSKYDAEHKPLTDTLAAFEKDKLPTLFNEWLANRPEAPPEPEFGDWHHVGPFTAASFDEAHDKAFPPEAGVDLKKTYEDGKLKWTPQPTWKNGVIHNTLTGDNAANYLFRTIEVPNATEFALSLGSDDSIKFWVNRKEILNKKIGRGAAADQEKVQLSLKKGRNELLMKIVNSTGPSGFYFKAAGDGAPPEVTKLLAMPQDKWNDKQRKQVIDWFRTIEPEWVSLNKAVVEHAKAEPKPQLTNIYAAKVRGSTYNFGGDTYKVYHLRRGNADNKQSEAKPGFLQVLLRDQGGFDRWLQTDLSTEATDSTPKPVAARIALGQWMSDTDQGAGHLLARVIVNRLWHHHFGRGIVSTTSDFGTRGERPTHPDLLDWLAGELIRGGWQLKPIHRLIMTSATYMQGNAITGTGRQHDPDNLLLWRRNARRLEAEVIRDSLLSVSGTLDRKQFGKGSLDQNMPRRSVYLTVKHGNLIPMMQLFDAPDAIQSTGDRQESTVAPQALAMLNSPLVHNLATKLAQRVRPNAETTIPEAINRAYETALSRPAAEEELTSMGAFIQRQTESRGSNGNAETLAFRDFCQVLLCMNEFVYVD